MCRTVIAEDRVRSQERRYVICGLQNDNWDKLVRVFHDFPYQFYSINDLYSSFYLLLTLYIRGIGVHKTRAPAEATKFCTIVLSMEPAS